MGPLKGQDSHDPQDLCPIEHDEAIWKSRMEDTLEEQAGWEKVPRR